MSDATDDTIEVFLVVILVTFFGAWWIVPWLIAGAVLYLAAGAVVLSPIFLWFYVREVRADRRKARELQECQEHQP